MYLVFDIGATKTRIGFSKNLETLDDIEIFPTFKKFSAQTQFLKKIVLTRGMKIKALAGGVPGALDRRKKRLIRTGNLPDWNGKPISSELKKIFKKPVFLENDAAIAGLGEAARGAGKNYKIVAYLTISTGVNGVRIVERKIDANSVGFEIGNQIIGGTANEPKQLEYLIGGIWFSRRHRATAIKLESKKIWNEVNTYVGYGISNTLRYWSPEVVILGGGIGMSNKLNFRVITDVARKQVEYYEKFPPIVKAKLGDLSGLYGALEYLRQQM